jgi:hypothetical protein
MSRSAHKPRTGVIYPRCRICSREQRYSTDKRVFVDDMLICVACALKVHDVLSEYYNMPEITALQRIAHRKKTGPEGWREPASQNEAGWVYYIRMGDLVKIGYALDVAKRMRAYPPTAELLAAHPGTQLVEREMHKRFKADLARGREWFRESPELVAHIAQVVERFGDQSALSYEYTKPKTQEERVAAMFATRQHLEIARGVHSAV